MHTIDYKLFSEAFKMSDLSATNCGCNNSCNTNSGTGNNFLWIILLLSCCGGNGLFGNGCGGNNNSCCESIIWLLLLSNCSGGNGLFGNGCGCGCS